MESQKISALSQSFSAEGLLSLWTVDLSHVNMGILRFTPDVDKVQQPISWGGEMYMPWPIKIEGLECSSQGANTRPTLSIGAMSADMTALLISDTGLQGAKVTRTRTYARFLDNGIEPSTTEHFPIEVYIIERISEWITGQYAVLELANPLDMEHATFPARQIIRDYCSWKYRIWDSNNNKFIYAKYSPCPYAGSMYFNNKNEITTQNQDICSKTIDGCKARFGDNAVLPFAGFPGVASLG